MHERIASRTRGSTEEATAGRLPIQRKQTERRKCLCNSDESKAQLKPRSALQVSQQDDAAERQADRIAQQITSPGARGPVERIVPIQPQIQNKCAACSESPHSATSALDPDPLTAATAIPKSGGEALDAQTRRRMEERLHFDFSKVRIFSDARAASLADRVDARAYTSGSNVVFGRGQYAPGTPAGDFLIAHELVHVAQQREGVLQRATRSSIRAAAPAERMARPKLCLYQVDHGKAFPHVAKQKAAEISAISVEHEYPLDADQCPRSLSTGAVPFGSGSHIINAIRNAALCTGHNVAEVHIFSHSSWNGIYGGGDVKTSRGLYRGGNPAANDPMWRERGARAVAELPLEYLADDVVFVLHGCNAALTLKADSNLEKNLAAEIQEHLGSKLRDPKVYGHTTSGHCGSYANWMEFSVAVPKGRRVSKNPYHLPPSER